MQKSKEYKKKMRQQKLIGMGLILIAILIFCMGIQETNPIHKDATGAVFVLPIGIYLLFSRECWIS